MDSNFISVPSNFKHMEGNSVNFSKTFDLNGTDNDEMLRLYLRKAGLSDEIECLAPEQRRAFIYDIIKSNKLPGYWLPSTLKTTTFMQSSPVTSLPPLPMRMETSSTNIESSTPILKYATMSTSSSSSSLKSMGTDSPIMPHRFVQSTKSPPSPTTFVTGKKGTKYEISGPVNFAHVSGDMTRDMTKNAFDLTLAMNDNVLKKYLIERGIKEEDICGMRKQDLIRNIVQSKYTWVPSKYRQSIKQEVKQFNTTTDGKTQPLILTQSSPVPSLKSPQATDPFANYALVNGRFTDPLTTHTTSSPIQNREPFSNYAMINSRFADPSEFPSPNSLSNNSHETPLTIVNLPPLSPQAIRPAPPPRKKVAPPAPPSTVKATLNKSPDVYHSSLGIESNESKIEQALPAVSKAVEDLYATPKVFVKPSSGAKHSSSSQVAPPPPPPPPPPISQLKKNIASTSDKRTSNEGDSRDVLLESIRMGIKLKKVDQKAATKLKKNIASTSDKRTSNEGDSRDVLLESIRMGIKLKKVDQKAATISGIKPSAERKPPVKDFLSELKMGITLRRIKNPADNPFSENDADESNA